MRWTHASILASLAVPVASAHAEDKSVHATFSGDVSASDNPSSAARGGTKEPDVYLQVRPGVLFGYETPRSTYEASGEVEALQYARRSDKPTLTFRVGLRSVFVTGPNSELSFTGTGSTGRLNAIANRTTPDQTLIQVTPSGAVDVIQGDVGENFGYGVNKSVRVYQGTFGRWAQATDSSEGYTRSGEFGGSLAADKTFQDNAFGIEGGLSYARLKKFQKAIPEIPIPESGRLDRQFMPHVGMNWRHDINRKWSSVASGGVAWVIPVFTDPYNVGLVKRGTTVSPVITGQLSYVDAWGYANFTLGRTLAPNLLIAQNTINDAATATVAVPLRWVEDRPGKPPRFLAAGTAGYAHTQLTNAASAAPEGTFSSIRFDVGVAYAPRPSISYSVRYALSYQTGDANATMVIPSILTNTVSFTFAMRYPEKLAVQPRKRRSVRADGSDLTPLDAPAEDSAGVGGNAGGSDE